MSLTQRPDASDVPPAALVVIVAVVIMAAVVDAFHQKFQKGIFFKF